MRTKSEIAYFSLSLGGVHAECYPYKTPGGCEYGYGSITYYLTAESFERLLADGYFNREERPVAGALVIDKRPALERNPGLAISLPMCNPGLPAGGVDSFSAEDRMTAAAMLPALGGEFATLAALAVADRRFSGLDSVAIDVYFSLWRAEGARIGRISADGLRVDWFDDDTPAGGGQ